MVSRFWLISIDDYAVTVALSGEVNGNYKVQSIGTSVIWQHPQLDSFLTAIDESLASAAEQIQLSSDSEPNTAAFIIPSTWIGSDGKINSDYKKLIEQLCQKLKFKPLGFISHDEAVIEESTAKEGLPVSFILLYLTPINFDLSLVYLGKIKSRFHQSLAVSFSPSVLEAALSNLNTESTLPPQVIITGHFEDTIIDDLKNYSWIGKKTIETFLHFPDFEAKKIFETITSYNQIITRQFQPENFVTEMPISEASQSQVEPVSEIENQVEEINDVDAADLGFSSTPQNQEPVVEIEPEPVAQTELIPIVANPEPYPSKPKLKFPSVPKIKLPSFKFALFIPALSPLLVLLFIFFYHADLTLFFTPIDVDESLNITLDPDISQISNNRIPVTKKSIDVGLTLSTETTGTKTIGDKAKGQVVIFNKSDKVQNLPKGSILTTGNGQQFTLTSVVQVAASNINLDQGIITMGQTKANVEAADIGPEFNLAKDTQLTFKDVPSLTLQAKADSAFNGGSKSQVAVVADVDKKALENQIDQAVTDNINQKINSEVNGLAGLLPKTINIQKNRNDFNREVGEEANNLTIQSDNTITAYVFETAQKKSIIDTLISQKPDYSQTTYNADKFTFTFTPTGTDKTTGTLNIKGQLTPNPDVDTFRHQLVAKTYSALVKIIPSTFPRVYNYTLTSNLPFATKVIMPIRWQNINIITK